MYIHAKIIRAQFLTLPWRLRLHCLCRRRPQDNQSCAWKSWIKKKTFCVVIFFFTGTVQERELFTSGFFPPNSQAQSETYKSKQFLVGENEAVRMARRRWFVPAEGKKFIARLPWKHTDRLLNIHHAAFRERAKKCPRADRKSGLRCGE